MPGVIVIGAGPGIGQAVARRFAREGHSLGLFARRQATLDRARASVRSPEDRTYLARVDVTEAGALRAALDEYVDRFGVPDVVVYNAALVQPDTLADLTARDHLDAWAVNVGGAITTAAHVLPLMAQPGRGTFIVTGGMPAPVPAYLSLSLGKIAVRTLVAILAEQFGPAGIHVASVTVAGKVAPGTAFDPDDIAEHYIRLHAEPPSRWQLEVLHDGSTAQPDLVDITGSRV